VVGVLENTTPLTPDMCCSLPSTTTGYWCCKNNHTNTAVSMSRCFGVIYNPTLIPIALL